MSTGLYSGVSGLAIGSGLWKAFPGLWGGATGLIDLPQTLSLDFLGGAPLDPRITFSRGSQATLTDSTGKIAYAPNNLLTNSEDFESANWVKSGAGTGTAPVITPNFAVAPNGTTTADRVALVNSGTTLSDWSWVYQNLTPAVANATYIFSVWVKAATPSDVGKTIIISAVSTPVATLTADWQRVFAIGTTVGTTTISFGIRIRGVEVPTTSATLFLWGAQAELVTYQTTPGTYNSTSPKNLLGYTQEFDNAAWTKSNAFVQTNLLAYSEAFDNAAWTKIASSITANATAAPDGTISADKIVENTASANHAPYRFNISLSATTYTNSVYLKAAERSWVKVTIYDGTTEKGAFFNLANGTIGNADAGATASIQSVGSGWYRCVVTVTAAAGTGGPAYYLATANGTGLPSYTGDGVSGLFIWGAQLVQGATAGDYQPTYAAAAAVQYPAPDNSLTADKLVENTATSSHGIVFGSNPSIPANTPIAVSIYVKPDGRNLRVTAYTASNGLRATFNFSTLAVTNGSYGNSTYTSGTITDVGGGWYRITLLGIASSTETNPTYAFEMLNGTTLSYAGDGNSGLFIWGAQLSNSASLDPYVYNPGAAPTSAAYYGPRFDYDPVTLAAKGLLIEEQRTNLLTYSQDFTNAAYVKAAGTETITGNAGVSPDGTTTATQIASTGSNGLYRTSIAVSNATAYTATVFVKRVSGQNTLQFGINANPTTGTSVFDIANGTISSNGASVTASSITSFGNGWYRLSVTATTTSTTTAIIFYSSGGAATWLQWGAQLEAGSFATSYIPTVASQVTRSVDVATMTGANFSNWYNQNAGSISVQGDIIGYTLNQMIVSLTDGTITNSVQIYNDVSGQIQANVWIGGLVLVPYTQNSSYKYALGLENNNVAASINGAAVVSDLSVGPPVAYNRLNIGSRNGSLVLNGHIRSISYYNTRLANTTLQALTV